MEFSVDGKIKIYVNFINVKKTYMKIRKLYFHICFFAFYRTNKKARQNKDKITLGRKNTNRGDYIW